MNPELNHIETQEDRYLDFMRDIIKISIYKCSCGFRAYGLPVSAHELKFKEHGMMIREPGSTESRIMGGYSVKCDCGKWFTQYQAYRDHCKATKCKFDPERVDSHPSMRYEIEKKS